MNRPAFDVFFFNFGYFQPLTAKEAAFKFKSTELAKGSIYFTYKYHFIVFAKRYQRTSADPGK